jgi:hypothetical protein
MSANPPTLYAALLQHVAHRTSRRVRNLDIEVGAERVVLRGNANTFHVKQLAQEGVRELIPDLRLENAIVVER